jgi:hypothetical protein
MIAEECFSERWINDLRKRYPQASPQILEKALHAFAVLGLLARSRYPFVFKAGTALILLLPEVKRLSIDVDIVGDIPLNLLADALPGTRFTGMEEDARKGAVPATHVKFFYQSLFVPAVNYVLVDMLRDDHPYIRLRDLPLRRDELFQTKENFQVKIPSVEDILGDKLTAIAPNTTGVLYGSGKSLEILKQLFDVGELVTHASAPDDIRSTFDRVRSQQNGYRKTEFTVDDILDDVLATSRQLCQIDFKGFVETSQTNELRAGMKAIHPYLLTERFSLPGAKLAASRAAFMAMVLKKRHLTVNLAHLRFTAEKIEEIRNEQLMGDLIAFNKLKRTNPEAFYYWWLVSKLQAGRQSN